MESVILIVDSDSNVLDLCRRHLAGWGYGVLWAESGEEALGVLFEHRVDVVVLSTLLPDASGFDLAGRIGRISDAGLVFITAQSALADRVRALRVGSDYLIRPFEPEELRLRLKMLAGRRCVRA